MSRSIYPTLSRPMHLVLPVNYVIGRVNDDHFEKNLGIIFADLSPVVPTLEWTNPSMES